MRQTLDTAARRCRRFGGPGWTCAAWPAAFAAVRSGRFARVGGRSGCPIREQHHGWRLATPRLGRSATRRLGGSAARRLGGSAARCARPEPAFVAVGRARLRAVAGRIPWNLSRRAAGAFAGPGESHRCASRATRPPPEPYGSAARRPTPARPAASPARTCAAAGRIPRSPAAAPHRSPAARAGPRAADWPGSAACRCRPAHGR